MGGLLAEIWSRECWGNWTLVDDDIVKAHNIARHLSWRDTIGYSKAQFVGSVINNIHSHESETSIEPNYHMCDILSDDPKLLCSIKESELLIDVTTTLHVPRELSLQEDVPRTVSAFITPSGMGSVMLIEDAAREIHSDSLEAQYYRAVLNESWGENHLSGHIGKNWVGAGCRDISLSLSNELIHLHSAVLSRSIRKSSQDKKPKIMIWDYEDEAASLQSYDNDVYNSHKLKASKWSIICDDGFINEMKALRSASLPNETGGILLGIVDQKSFTISLVKCCKAPKNSISEPTSFRRAAYISPDLIEDCHRRTAGVVTYVGEWHSHPDNIPALPSPEDVGQLNQIASELNVEGNPALMAIISKSSLGIYVESRVP